jgi:hypothetical protein
MCHLCLARGVDADEPKRRYGASIEHGFSRCWDWSGGSRNPHSIPCCEHCSRTSRFHGRPPPRGSVACGSISTCPDLHSPSSTKDSSTTSR